MSNALRRVLVGPANRTEPAHLDLGVVHLRWRQTALSAATAEAEARLSTRRLAVVEMES